MKYSISAFFPAYNDEGTIEKMVLTAISTLKQITRDYEVIVVDDCSPDNSGKIADNLSKRFKEVQVVHHKRNMGYGGALKSGFKNAKKDLIFYTDGDGQYDVRELKKLFPLIKEADVVNGYKISRGDSLHRTILGRMYHWGAKIFFNLKVKDVDCDFRLMKRSIFNKIKLKSNSGIICIEMIKKIQSNGYVIKEVPIQHYPRICGKSQFFKIKNVLNVFRDFIKLWWQLVILKK